MTWNHLIQVVRTAVDNNEMRVVCRAYLQPRKLLETNSAKHSANNKK
jgi:hypothetical protein